MYLSLGVYAMNEMIPFKKKKKIIQKLMKKNSFTLESGLKSELIEKKNPTSRDRQGRERLRLRLRLRDLPVEE
jgi:hypothetical protein